MARTKTNTIKDIAYRSGLALTDSKISSRKMNVISDTYSYYFDGPGQRDILGALIVTGKQIGRAHV